MAVADGLRAPEDPIHTRKPLTHLPNGRMFFSSNVFDNSMMMNLLQADNTV
jgi:hypothetical protein